MLTIRLEKTSPTRHRLEIVRADGSRDVADLETRSCLLHDLVHFAVESEARLADSFYGRLARGVQYAQLTHPDPKPADEDELMATELVVGPLQSAWRKGTPPALFADTLRSYLAAIGAPVPAWFDTAFVQRAVARVTALDGQWRATPFGTAMELRFATT